MAKDTMQSAGDWTHSSAPSEGTEVPDASDRTGAFCSGRCRRVRGDGAQQVRLAARVTRLAERQDLVAPVAERRRRGVTGPLLRRLQAREQQVCGGGDPQVIVGHEAGYDGFW